MKRVTRLGMIAVLGVSTMVAPAVAGDVTVGRFYATIAQAQHLGSVNAASAEANLRAAGFDLPDLALDKSLTEGDVASISNALGLAVTTQRPSQPISESQLDQFMSAFGSELSVVTGSRGDQSQTHGQGTGGIDPGNSGNGKGKKKGHNKSASEPL